MARSTRWPKGDDAQGGGGGGGGGVAKYCQVYIGMVKTYPK